MEIPELTPSSMKDSTTLMRLTEFLRSLNLIAGDDIEISSQGSAGTRISSTAAGGGGGGSSSGGTTVLPAKISLYTAGTDTHRAQMYGNGFGQAVTETVDLDSICNLLAGQELPLNTELFVLTAGTERIGLVNGVF